jgi:hypothetical protein
MNPNLTSSSYGHRTHSSTPSPASIGYFLVWLFLLLVTCLSLVYLKARIDINASRRQKDATICSTWSRPIDDRKTWNGTFEDPMDLPSHSAGSPAPHKILEQLNNDTGPEEQSEQSGLDVDRPNLAREQPTESSDTPSNIADKNFDAPVENNTWRRPWHFGAVRYTNLTSLIEDLPSSSSQAFKFVPNFPVSLFKQLLHSSKSFYFYRLALFDTGFPEKSICALSQTINFAYAVQESFAPKILRFKFHTVP